MPIYAFPASAIAVAPQSGLVILPPFIKTDGDWLVPGIPTVVPGFLVGINPSAPQTILVGYNLIFHASPPIAGPAGVEIVMSLSAGGSPTEVARFKMSPGAGPASITDIPVAGVVPFNVPAGGNPVEMIYASHFVEHLTYEECPQPLREGREVALSAGNV